MNSLENVEKLIDLGVGDVSRLQHIKHILEENKILYSSDADYLNKLIQEYIEKSETPENPSDSSENMSIKN
ncbi:MAG: hypothetical protein J4F36_13895 [Nitrosopumilaceae archaeon]|nr:hypothetical protein [Nitrosopumilaceae archaeon]